MVWDQQRGSGGQRLELFSRQRWHWAIAEQTPEADHSSGVVNRRLQLLRIHRVQNATAYYLTVDELVARGPSLTTQSIQVKGTLVPESFVREGNGSTIAHFTLTEGGENLPATYDGVLPDLFFNSHSEIVLSGEYNQSGTFVTDLVRVKCPSKYQSEEYAEPNPSL